jgi:hypothetical protein
LAGQPSLLKIADGIRHDEGFLLRLYLGQAVNDKAHYIGITRNLKARLVEHNRGKCPHTSKHRPWKIETALSPDEFRVLCRVRRAEHC